MPCSGNLQHPVEVQDTAGRRDADASGHPSLRQGREAVVQSPVPHVGRANTSREEGKAGQGAQPEHRPAQPPEVDGHADRGGRPSKVGRHVDGGRDEEDGGEGEAVDSAAAWLNTVNASYFEPHVNL